MQHLVLVSVLLLLAYAGYRMGRSRALASSSGRVRRLHSLPGYYGLYVALWCGVPSLLIFLVWVFFEPFVVERVILAGLPEVAGMRADQVNLLIADIRNVAAGAAGGQGHDPAVVAAAERYRELRALAFASLAAVALAASGAGLALARGRVRPELRARNRVERFTEVVLFVCSLVAILTTVGIVLSVLFEAVRFFRIVPLGEFLFGLHWSPQIAIREDQVGSSGAFGAVPLFAGTLLITAIAMLVAVPVGLFSAIYLAEYAPHWARAALKPVLEILAGIPTVVYGFFAALTVAPAARDAGARLGLDVASESALAAGLVMGIMIIPFVSSLSDDVISAVPRALRDGSLALGATSAETIKRVVLPAALPGIVGSVLLAVSRGIGETMIVVMAAGLSANLTANPLEAVTTVTVQIVTLLVGDQEFDSAKTLSAFALALVLFLVTLALNVIALVTVRKYREKYE